MQRWQAQLALVAYLLGGWIIPATHGPGSHGAAGHGVCSHAAHWHSVATDGAAQPTASADQPTAVDDRDCCGDQVCGFAAYRSSVRLAPSASDDTALTAGLASWQAADSCHTHAGLCAICVSQNHASPTVDAAIELHAETVVQWLPMAASQRFSLPVVGVSLSRGPPAV